MCVFLLPSSSSSRREGSSGGARSIPALRGSGARRGVPGEREEKMGSFTHYLRRRGRSRGGSATSAPGRRGPAVQYAKWEGLGRRGLDGKVESRAAKLGAVTVELGSGRRWLEASSRYSGNGERCENEGEENQKSAGAGRWARENRLGLRPRPRWRVASSLSARGVARGRGGRDGRRRAHGRSARRRRVGARERVEKGEARGWTRSMDHGG
ncbi:hypothetical protein BS78_K051600 [Paspalum vaginatum]|uniref:Uncharacterized protein n=1 Tax=Paspalum vaginatum TaxID=158149 RepID=A0A9W7X8H2_9POAL|nr:hypothetical protein BS78_K051600 [Paspalum vaginatum]